MKKTYEGYLCHTKTREESYGYADLLSESLPVKRIIEDHCGEMEEQIVVPSENCVIFDADNLFDSCEYGKKYRVTIEEI